MWIITYGDEIMLRDQIISKVNLQKVQYFLFLEKKEH